MSSYPRGKRPGFTGVAPVDAEADEPERAIQDALDAALQQALDKSLSAGDPEWGPIQVLGPFDIQGQDYIAVYIPVQPEEEE